MDVLDLPCVGMDAPTDAAGFLDTPLSVCRNGVNEWWLEVHCTACGRTTLPPIRMLVRERGDMLLRDLIRRLKCQCGGRVATAYMSESGYREPILGPGPAKWSVQVWPEPGAPTEPAG